MDLINNSFSLLFSYEERNRSLEIVSSRHKESNTFEEFTSRVYAPISRGLGIIGSHVSVLPSGGISSVGSVGHGSQLAAALIDHQKQQGGVKVRERELTQHTITISSNSSTDHPSPRPSRKLHHPFKTGTGVKKSSSSGQANIGAVMTSPPESPTMQGMRRFK